MKSAKALLVVGIFAIGLLMSFGYATISQDISNISKGAVKTAETTDKWDVQITNVSVLSSEGMASNEVPTYTKSTATFDSSLLFPEDSISYEITIKNFGDKPAKLSNLNVTEQEDGAENLFYAADTPTDVLEPGATTTMIVSVGYDSTYVGNVTSNSKSGTVYVQYTELN